MPTESALPATTTNSAIATATTTIEQQPVRSKAPSSKATTTTTTVIKTTMVKRSPSIESPAITEKSRTTEEGESSDKLDQENPSNGQYEPKKSVKERVAAIVAGNEKSRHHDNSIKSKTQCNRIQNNMTIPVKSAINSLNLRQTSIDNNNSNIINNISNNNHSQCLETSSSSPSSSPTEEIQTNSIVDIPCHKSGSNDVQEEESPAATNTTVATENQQTTTKTAANSEITSIPTIPRLYANTGCATVPRRRNPALAANERCCNSSSKYGSNSTVVNADKKLLSSTTKMQSVTDKQAALASESNRKLAALDNLDLALSLDLMDEDGEDPYFALQEYLERVKHEINEVFELHKARQRMQQQQQNQEISTATPSEELSHGVESDVSSADINTTGHNNTTTNNQSNVLSMSATLTTAREEETQAMTEISSQSDKIEHASQRASANASTNNDDTHPRTATIPNAITPSSALKEGEENGKNVTTINGEQQPVVAATQANIVKNTANDDVNIWANKFLQDLDNLMASDKPTSSSAATSPTSTASPMLLSAAATAAIQSRYGKNVCEREREQQQLAAVINGVVLRPEKHTTIPLQSFNLDCERSLLDIGGSNQATTATPTATKPNVVFTRTMSAPAQHQQHQQQHQHHQQQQQHIDNKSSCVAGGKSNRNSLTTFNGASEQPRHHHAHNHQHHHNNLTNFHSNDTAKTAAATILKIEETSPTTTTVSKTSGDGNTAINSSAQVAVDEDARKSRRQRQLESDMETIHNALLSQSRQLLAMEATYNNNNNNINSSCSSRDKNMQLTSATATSIPKRERERINHATTSATTTKVNFIPTALPSSMATPSKLNIGPTSAATTTTTTTTTASSNLLNGSDTTKKGSTSTIWTSEESILRSVGAVDEDNNSTSSSACEDASGVLSSGKSGVSLDSSGLDNDNNESGIGTATPPKDLSYWKSPHNDNESVSSLDALRKMKFQKSSSVASSDDPDLLEVLSLCDEPQSNEDICDDVDESHEDFDERQVRQQAQTQKHRQQNHRQIDNDVSNPAVGSRNDLDAADEEDEGHDEFDTVPYCDCDCTDGDASSNASGIGLNGNRVNGGPSLAVAGDVSAVVLRRKYHAAPVIVPFGGRVQKCRSHSLDTSSLSNNQHHYHHPHYPQSHLTRKLHHLQNRTKERGQLSLALRQEPFQSMLAPTHFHELPSPSSASLHSGHESMGIQELTTKSNSAPLLLKQEKRRDDFAGQKLTLRYSRSQSDRYLAEIEAVEACKWLRAAGFPQYGQMYEDHQFPIDLTNVAKDHTNLENDQLQSLYRRLCVLNRCANMRLDQSHKTQTPQKEDSDDENFALSENWTFQPHIRRWSRIGEMGLELAAASKLNAEKTESSSKESSPDRYEDDSYDMSSTGLALSLPGAGTSDSTDTTLNDSADAAGGRLKRTGSERLKDGAKAFLRRVESIKSRRRKRQNREGVVISEPHGFDLSQLGQRGSLRKPEAVYSTPPSPSAVSPMHTFPKGPFFGNELKIPSQSDNYLSPHRASPKRTPTTPRSMRTSPLHFFSNQMPHLKEGKSDDSSSYYSDSQESSTGGKLTVRKTPSKTRRFLQRTGKVDDIGAHSDSECHQGRKLLIKDANSNNTEIKLKKLSRGGSLNLGRDPKKRDGFRTTSFRSRSSTRKDKPEEGDNLKKMPVVRWHSFQMEERPQMIFRKCFAQKVDPNAGMDGTSFAAMSAGQLQIIRKLALVILTGYMERYCPTHRSGWNWELPKFIKKIKMPDYRDKKVFGVPPLLILQRTGQTLPIAVRAAFRWLQLNALDQIGLFRKSGVKSRIIRLKELIEFSETTSECMEVFDAQQAYDVADMLKQYFRDLPESLLTTKMSETFVAIFQHLPPDVRIDAVQCAVLLLPDENREILYALLEFLTLVACNSQYNQMTANNLAVCLAPSLFHTSVATGAASVSASPRRRKGAGVPDVKELSEAKASHECLAFMIENYKKIFTATREKISKCNFGYMEESKPVPLEALGEGMQFHNWRGYLYECTSATIKEGREKTRGWITIASPTEPSVDIAYKKVGDGHPLRLWRCITEVEGPPKEVLNYIIKQRASWDVNLLQCQTVKKLDERTEIFQYLLDGQVTTDFCVLRSWQTDLPRGACVIVETSIDHDKAKPMCGAVRGVVLASRYLIEPCGSGRSRVMHLARVDVKGKTPEWYNKSYGHICSHYLSKIRMAFKHIAEGADSKV